MNKIHQYLDNIKEKEKLAGHTTFRIGGEAEFFYEAADRSDLLFAAKTCSYIGMPFHILAGGSNVLVSDKGAGGLVLKVKNNKYSFDEDDLIAEAGVSLPFVVAETARRGLSGLEWAVGIPGTVGGALFGNAGSFGKSISDVVDSVDIYDPDKDEARTLGREECDFDYRNSIFKKNNLVILGCRLQLKKADSGEIKKSMQKNLQHKRQNHPVGIMSAGCVFKNVDKSAIKENANLLGGAMSGFEKIPAGFLIEKSGLKNYSIGDAMVSGKHANFILNNGNASADQIVYLINQVKKRVHHQFGVVLEEEIRYIE